jgi:very-short-patch-repair endonuclease
VYAVGHGNLALEGCFMAAVKACGTGGVLSHYSAAALFGLVKWDGRAPEVTVVGKAARAHKALRVHRTGALAEEEVWLHRGIPVTSPARTLIDLASTLDHRRLRRAVREAQARRLVDLAELAAFIRRLGRRRGSSRLARIIATGPAPTRSELEDAVLDLMLNGGLEHPDVNVPLILDGRVVVPDFRWPECRLVVEADGAAWHDHKLTREDDAERQALLEAHGERVLRVTWEQAVARPRQTLGRVRAAGAPPLIRPPP